MKKNANDDFEAFEEWEKGEGPEVHETSPGSDDMNQETLIKSEEELAGSFEEPADEIVPQSGGHSGADDLPAAKGLANELALLAPDVPVNLVAVIGKTTESVGTLMGYRIGQVIDLGRAPGETVDLVANGKLIARGELVEMDGKMGVRILKMVR